MNQLICYHAKTVLSNWSNLHIVAGSIYTLGVYIGPIYPQNYYIFLKLCSVLTIRTLPHIYVAGMMQLMSKSLIHVSLSGQDFP